MNTRLEVLEDSKTINELFTYAAEANEYRVFNTFSIERGLLDDSDVAHPIYGLQLGMIDYSFLKDEHGDYILDGDGHRILVEKTDVNRFLRITPEKISLLSGNTEVASISEDWNSSTVDRLQRKLYRYAKQTIYIMCYSRFIIPYRTRLNSSAGKINAQTLRAALRLTRI